MQFLLLERSGSNSRRSAAQCRIGFILAYADSEHDAVSILILVLVRAESIERSLR